MNWWHRVGLAWSQWQLRGRDLYTVDIRTALVEGGKALICLPDREEQIKAALDVWPALREWFSPVDFVLLAPSESLPDLADPRFPVFMIPHSVSRWGLPYRPIIERARKFAPTVAVDLHPEFTLATAHLCVQSGARLRIGFGAPHGGYFNLHYTWTDGGNLSTHYRSFVAMLTDLRSNVAF